LNLRALELPSGVHAAVLKLLVAIEAAESLQGVNIARLRAEGFVLGLETAQAFKLEVIEVLYIGFDEASCARLAALRTEYRET